MEETKKTLFDRVSESNWTPFIIMFVVVTFWMGLGIFTYTHYFRTNPSFAGQFGDMFGVANSLFTGLAFGGLFYTMILQRKEVALSKEALKITRDQLILTKEELILSRKEYEKQNLTLSQQRFENTFFNMLLQHNETVKSITYKGKDGREAFAQFYVMIRAKWSNKRVQLGRAITLEESLQGYLEVFNEAEDRFGHYFRNLYNVVRLINDSDETIDKKKYARLVRAQLSTFELIALFYNCLTANGSLKFKPLIQEYRFFKTLNSKLLEKEIDKVAYDAKAFS